MRTVIISRWNPNTTEVLGTLRLVEGHVVCSGDSVFIKNLENQGLLDPPVFPQDGDIFLNAVLNTFRNAYCMAEEITEEIAEGVENIVPPLQPPISNPAMGNPVINPGEERVKDGEWKAALLGSVAGSTTDNSKNGSGKRSEKATNDESQEMGEFRRRIASLRPGARYHCPVPSHWALRIEAPDGPREGYRIHTLGQMRGIIQRAPSAVVLARMEAEGHNDFADWVETIFGLRELANQLRNCRSPIEMKAILDSDIASG